MSWAGRRRFIILALLIAVGVSVASITLIATLHQTPSCTDGIQNQDEDGVDCGGACRYLCTALQEPPTTLFTQAIPNGTGRTDVIASIENKNATAAAKSVPYSIVLYGADRAFIQQVSGTVDLAPGATARVFVPGVASGARSVAQAFLTIDTALVQWYAASRPSVPQVAAVSCPLPSDTPRIIATLSNVETSPVSNLKVIVAVFNTENNVIAASQTIVPYIPSQGSALATFTWNTPFSAPCGRVEVTPVVAL